MRILFVEPPKASWFILGEYLPPPFGLLALAAHVEKAVPDAEVEVLDCQAEGLDWDGLESRIARRQPDAVAPSGLSTCNAYAALRTAGIAKKVDPRTITILGGQHFTALAKETLQTFPQVDYIARGEGEQTIAELLMSLSAKTEAARVTGISFRTGSAVLETPDRPLIENLDDLPFPAYDHVKQHMKKYHFALMAEMDSPFAIIEGSRGCYYSCAYCSQWRFWGKRRRAKSAKRIADEFQMLHDAYGSKFLWLTDDNLGLGEDTARLCDELIERGLSKEVTWFMQARCDDIVNNKDTLPKIRRAGNIWMLVGMDRPDESTMDEFHRIGVNKDAAKQAVELLRQNDIFSQGTFIVGSRGDSRESMKAVLDYADWLDPDIATFMTLTPFPGTEVYEEAKRNNWIEDTDWNHYDMVHAIMPTGSLTREEVQKQLYECYRVFFGSWKRRYQGLFSKNPIAKRTYQYLSREAILTGLRSLF